MIVVAIVGVLTCKWGQNLWTANGASYHIVSTENIVSSAMGAGLSDGGSSSYKSAAAWQKYISSLSASFQGDLLGGSQDFEKRVMRVNFRV